MKSILKSQYRGCPSIAANVLGINEGGMVNGVLSRKVEITLNSAVSLVQTVQPLLFIPCYKSGCGELRGVTRRSRNAFEPQLAYNGLGLCEGRASRYKCSTNHKC